ncbi:hypothetical protein BDZ89DRAFT_256204 [Hymenopellis radicata]|nr:hypothetical protein BDZ89DRAFT_256204 [Hymenopellis radicata]
MKIVCAERDTPLEAADASSPSSAAYVSGSPYPAPSSITTSPALSGANPLTRASPTSATTDSASLMSLRLQIVVGSEHSSPPPKEYPSPPPKAYLPPHIRAGDGQGPIAPLQQHASKCQDNETIDSRNRRDSNIDTSRIQSSNPTREDASASPPMPHNHVERFRSWPRGNYPCKGYVPPKKSRRTVTLRDIFKDAPTSWQLEETALQARLKALAENSLHPVVDDPAEGAATLASGEKDVHVRRDQTPPPIAHGQLTNGARPGSGDKTMEGLAAQCTKSLEAQLSALLQRAPKRRQARSEECGIGCTAGGGTCERKRGSETGARQLAFCDGAKGGAACLEVAVEGNRR